MTNKTNSTSNILTVEQVNNMFIYVGEKVIESKPLLTDIDCAIGDGDHGIGMEVGFKNALEKLEANNYDKINDIFAEIGKAMIGNMGGASGVLFGTLFLSGVKGQEKIEQLDVATLSAIFQNSLLGVQARGKAEVGDKTMIDALSPAVNALREANENKLGLVASLRNASEAAKRGVEDTKVLVAKFGRAKSLGERVIGHQDAGATTISIIFESMQNYVEELEKKGELLNV
ncbi:dihydroxyacetone kinase subunit DhaL [Planococcus sp. CAU13]|uniref:dihydroxyacetone kinase subunit DhaL n=1 Tax=Planococcus sp. CAU13 TaxID=1541197 RepID=UPI00068F7C54|nr:dihydroxyacetone kinase subunit DhaL [Planococcus sp. CAU13]